MTDPDGRNPAARLTIDLAAGDRWLIGLTQLGDMFWAAECQGSRSLCTTPPANSCEGGVGVGSKTYNIPIPMPPLQQE
jgi:hypothetical protein